MNFTLPKIYPITDARLSKISHVEQVEKLVAAGAEFIQLREKHASANEFYEYADAVLNLTRPNNVKIIINDRVDIALALKADGVHLGQDDLPPNEARKILGERAIIGFSTHNTEQAIAAAQLEIDYLAIGPIFSTRTKENPDPVVGLKGLEKVRRAIGNFPLVAIGGVNASNLPQIFDAGADTAAVIGGIIADSKKITENYKKLSSI